jgi:hypothetical protein
MVRLSEIVSDSQEQVYYKEFIVTTQVTSFIKFIYLALHNCNTKWKFSIADVQFNPI